MNLRGHINLSTLAACLACTGIALAGNVGVRVDGVEQSPVTSGNPISIDVDGRDTEVEIHIYDIGRWHRSRIRLT